MVQKYVQTLLFLLKKNFENAQRLLIFPKIPKELFCFSCHRAWRHLSGFCSRSSFWIFLNVAVLAFWALVEYKNVKKVEIRIEFVKIYFLLTCLTVYVFIGRAVFVALFRQGLSARISNWSFRVVDAMEMLLWSEIKN